MQPDQQLIDAIYRERVLRARAMPPGQKLTEGVMLFRRACQWAEVGIRDQYPNADDAEVRRILLERLDRLRKVEETGWINSPKSPE